MPELPYDTDPKFASQWEAVRAAFAEKNIELDFPERATWLESRRDGRITPPYVYQKDHVLVRAEDEEEVLHGHDRLRDVVPVPNRGTRGVGLYRINESVSSAMGRFNRGGRKVVSPNHLVSICPVQLCPADEPVPLPVGASHEPHPPRTFGDGGQGVTVEVPDTGLVPGFAIGHEWLADIQTFQKCSAFGPTGAIKEYAGHGTFVTGVLRCAAPKSDVNPTNIFQFGGATMEDQLGQALMTAIDNKPDIISLSAGGTTRDNELHVALEPFYAALKAPDCRTLLVAAAGNDGDTQEFYPAAYSPRQADRKRPAIVSVGALRYDSKGRACFSNYGNWVDVYALGERHVNAFMSGAYSYVDPQRDDLSCRFSPEHRYPACTCVTMPPQGAFVAFRGMARWSGTSFSTPLVAGMIATHLSRMRKTRPDADARDAAHEVLATAKEITDVDGQKLQALHYSPVTDFNLGGIPIEASMDVC